MKIMLRTSLLYLLSATLIFGVAYPLVVTDLSMLLFPKKAGGSLVEKDGRILGSELIGQPFHNPAYFSSRPSAVDYNPNPSSGSNLGPTSKKLQEQVMERRHRFVVQNGITDTLSIPSEMLTASASGLDPHISPGAAFMQTDRIARSRGFTDAEKVRLIHLVARLSEKPQFLFLGEPRVNVFKLNLELDKIRHE